MVAAMSCRRMCRWCCRRWWNTACTRRPMRWMSPMAVHWSIDCCAKSPWFDRHMNLRAIASNLFYQRWQRWLARRIPASRTITLDQRRVFIFPSRAGLWFLAVLGLMLIAAINYQNNMAFALVFFLFALFVVAILHTFANLSGLQLEAQRVQPVFAGDTAEFDILLKRTPKRQHHSIQLGWAGQPLTTVSLVDTEQQVAKIFHVTQRRGWLQPGRLLIQTVYPLGLLRAWSWVDLDLWALVYPRPIACPRPLGGGEGQ